MKTFFKIFITTAFVLVSFASSAQCVMCKAVAESSLVDGQSGLAIGLNDGIFYLAAFPYMIVFTLIYLYLRKQNRIKQDRQQLA